MWAYFTGGFRVRFLGVPLSVRGEHRAAVVALMLAVFGFLLLDEKRRISGGAVRWVAGRARRLGSFVARISVRHMPPALAGAAAAAIVGGGLWFTSYSAGGSDPYGYVSQATLWLQGELKVRQPLAAQVPWPNADFTFTPLGYRPAENHTIVPVYAPGLPLLMALFQLATGSCGPYIVGPICGAALVLLTYALGMRL